MKLTSEQLKQLEETGKVELNLNEFDFHAIVKDGRYYKLYVNGKISNMSQSLDEITGSLDNSSKSKKNKD